MLGGKRNEVETPISNICLRLFFSQSLISNEMTYFWTDTNAWP